MKSICLYALLISIIFNSACKPSRAVLEKKDETNGTIKNEIFSANTMIYLEDLEKENPASGQPGESFMEKYGIKKIRDQYFVGALIKVAETFQQEELEKLSFIIGSKTGNIVTLKIPYKKVRDIENVPGILYIDIDRKNSLKKIN